MKQKTYKSERIREPGACQSQSFHSWRNKCRHVLWQKLSQLMEAELAQGSQTQVGCADSIHLFSAVLWNSLLRPCLPTRLAIAHRDQSPEVWYSSWRFPETHWISFILAHFLVPCTGHHLVETCCQVTSDSFHLNITKIKHTCLSVYRLLQTTLYNRGPRNGGHQKGTLGAI